MKPSIAVLKNKLKKKYPGQTSTQHVHEGGPHGEFQEAMGNLEHGY